MLVRPLLFLSSYAPLFALLMIRFNKPAWLSYTCGALAVAGVAAYWLLLHLDNRKSRGPYRILSVKDGGSQATGYLASYILPLVALDEPTTRDIVAYSGFLLIAAVLYMKTSLILVNPLLYLFGWKIHEIEDTQGFRGYLVSTARVLPGEVVLATRFGEDVLIHRSAHDQLAPASKGS